MSQPQASQRAGGLSLLHNRLRREHALCSSLRSEHAGEELRCRRWGLHCWTARQADQASCTIAKTRAANIACASANGGATHDRPAKLNFAQVPCSQCCGEYGRGGELRGVLKSGLTGAGRAMAPRTPSLAERLAEPWEGV